MGIRGELFSTRVSCEGRTYFFNVKENRMGDVFLTIVESKPTEADNFERRSIVVFRDDVKDFLKAFQGALGYLEKPGAQLPAPRFEPQSAGQGKRPRSPAGFAGAPGPGQGAAGEVGSAARKRRLVVRRKDQPAGPPGAAPTDEGA